MHNVLLHLAGMEFVLVRIESFRVTINLKNITKTLFTTRDHDLLKQDKIIYPHSGSFSGS